MTRSAAILLVGPTGSGKTPLGCLIQREGLWGRPCAHFDFGQRLRDIVDRGECPGLGGEHMAYLAEVLKRGALLENKDFHIIDAILRAFIAQQGLPPEGLIVLNGVPRHPEQAKDIDTMVVLQAVIELRSTPDVIATRIRKDTGGDRRGRIDDSPAEVRRKLQIYQQRTAPVIDYYRRSGTPVVSVDVDVASTAEAMLAEVRARGGKD